ncbi:ring finger protein-like [Rhynchonycteris naso]
MVPQVGRCGWARAGPVQASCVGPGAAGAGTGTGVPAKLPFGRDKDPGGGSGCFKVSVRPRGHSDLHGPHQPTVTLGSHPTHPDSCPGTPTHGPADLSLGLPGPSSASLGPEHLDPLSQVLEDEGLDSQASGNPPDSRTPDSEHLLGTTGAAQPWARPTEEDEEEGCPICAEPYGSNEHRLALLNCGHGLCSGCLHQLLDTTPSADLGRVRCPLCRQKTPMLEWEICRLQEELLQADGPPRPPSPPTPSLPRRGSGPWARLEHRYQLRFLAGPVGSRGCLPFLPCPPCLGARLWALRARGACARRLALLGLLALELLGLLLIFTPLMLLGLLFMLLDRSRH